LPRPFADAKWYSLAAINCTVSGHIFRVNHLLRLVLFLALCAPSLTLSAKQATPARSKPAPAKAPIVAAEGPDDDLNTWCDSVTLAIPQIKLKPCVTAQLEPVATKSVKGRKIMMREFKPAQKPAARVLVIGGIHGDELTASSIVFRWLELLQQPDGDDKQFHWRVIPVLNPDGLLAKPPTRVNARGVDLNRNFPTYNWLKEAPRYWETKTQRDPRRFPGKSPLSEPESRWLHDEITRFKPDVIVTIHAPYGPLRAPASESRRRLSRFAG
jgi:hypothetical protein